MTSDPTSPGAATEVADGIWQLYAPFLGVPLMLYVIDGGTELALVDSGINTTPDAFILPFFSAFGRKPDLLVNSHGHVDHFGGNARLREAYPELRIAAHHVDARWIEDTRRHLHEMYAQMPDDWWFEDGGAGLLELCGGNSAVDVRLDDDDVLEIGARRFAVHRSGGHSPGHISLFEMATGIAVTGDAALGWGPDTDEGTPDAPSFYYDADAYLAGGRMALGLDARLYCTGHFGAVDAGAMGKIVEDSAAFVASFDRFILEALAGGASRTLAEIAAHIGTRLPSYEFGFHIHASAQANLDRFMRTGRVRTRIIDGRRHYVRAAD